MVIIASRWIAVLLLVGCVMVRAGDEPKGWYILRWAEKPSSHGPSTKAKPEDVTEFVRVASYDHEKPEEFDAFLGQLREGDVLAYYMGKWEARKAIFKGQLNKVGYRLLKYGHLAIVVADPDNGGKLRLFSSQSFKGPNTEETLETLKTHSVHVYRLNQWSRVDTNRLHDFVHLAKEKAGHWYGYDFSGMFGLWNSNLEPGEPSKIGHDYICSTIVAAALFYSGVELDAIQRGGVADLVSPYQVVRSKGRIIPPPDVKLQLVSGNGKGAKP